MTRRTSHSPIVCLSLAFLLTGLVACSKGSEGEEQTAAATEAGAATAAGTTTDPATAGQAGQNPANPGAPIPGLPGQAAPAAPVDTSRMPAVVARVNGTEIKKEDLLRQTEMMRMRMMQSSRGQQIPPLTDAFYKQILDGMVAQALFLQEARKLGVAASDQEVQAQIDQMKKRFPDAASFEKALAAQGLTEKGLVSTMRDESMIQKYVTTSVFSEVKVDDAAARQFYDANQAQMQRPERVHLRHILIRAEPTATADVKAKAKEKAEALLKRVKGGEDFAKLAAEASEDPSSKTRGGDMSWISRGQTPPTFEQPAFALARPNDVSPVVESQFGYHILQLVERQAAGAVPFEEAKGRITQTLQQKLAGEKLQAKVEQLKKQGKVEVSLQ